MSNFASFRGAALPRDPVKAAQVKAERLAYREREEAKVFIAIGKAIERGEAPLRIIKPGKPLTGKERRTLSPRVTAHLRRQLDAVVTTLQTEVTTLVKLCEADHPLKFAPTLLQGHARILGDALESLHTLLGNERRWDVPKQEP